jgi:hypothetical protein
MKFDTGEFYLTFVNTLDNQATMVQSWLKHKIFPLASASTPPEPHPASYPMGTRGKVRPGRDIDHSPPSSAEVKNE